MLAQQIFIGEEWFSGIAVNWRLLLLDQKKFLPKSQRFEF